MPLPRLVAPGLRDRLRRVAWNLIWSLLYRPSPTAMHAWRCMLLRSFGATIGPRAHPYPTARIWAPWLLEMGHGSCLGPGADCYNVARVTLGRDCVVSQKTYLCAASHDVDDAGFPLTGAPISIGARAWVAAQAFVGPGVTVGDGAVVAACAVVVRDVSARTVVAGNPARIVRESDRGALSA